MKRKTDRSFILLFLPLIYLLPSCHPHPVRKQITTAFYYWRSAFGLDSTEKRYLTETETSVLYIRFFDVIWDSRTAQPVPAAPLYFTAKPDNLLKYVPVVFIANEAIQHCNLRQISVLANHVLAKIETISKEFNHGFNEIQMDCDWTVNTKDKYFLLLQYLKEKAHLDSTSLSVTLRLHQVKYSSRTGIPPADRVMLMFYNMGDWRDPQTHNSIYDLRTASKYLNHLSDYPLPVDIVLPLLRWTIVYRNSRFLTFVNYVTGEDLVHCSFLDRLPGGECFAVKKDTFAFGCAFRKGDFLRSEVCRLPDLLEGKKQLLRRIRNAHLTLALFHLDKQLLKYYSHAQVEKIFSAVQ